MAQNDQSPYNALVTAGHLPRKAVIQTAHPTRDATLGPNIQAQQQGQPPPQSDSTKGTILDPTTAHNIVQAALGFSDIPTADEVVIANILRSGADDASAQALAYLRGTQWHAQRYPGFAAG